MTPADRAQQARQAQGLAPTVDDPAVLARVAVLIASRKGASDG